MSNDLDSMAVFLRSQGFSYTKTAYIMDFVTLCRRIESRSLGGACLNYLIIDLYNSWPCIWENLQRSPESFKKISSFYYAVPKELRTPIWQGPHSKKSNFWTGQSWEPCWVTSEGYARNGIVYKSLKDLQTQAYIDLGIVEKEKYAGVGQDPRYSDE